MMKYKIFGAILLFHFNCLAQKLSIEQSKLTDLFTQVLRDLAKNRDNQITYPFINYDNINYIQTFVKDGGLNDLKEKKDWTFISDVNNSTKFQYQKVERDKIKKQLILSNIKISRFKNEKLTFTPFVFSNNFNKTCFVFQETYFPGNNTANRLNTIICFYEYIDNVWVRIHAWPVVID